MTTNSTHFCILCFRCSRTCPLCGTCGCTDLSDRYFALDLFTAFVNVNPVLIDQAVVAPAVSAAPLAVTTPKAEPFSEVKKRLRQFRRRTKKHPRSFS